MKELTTILCLFAVLLTRCDGTVSITGDGNAYEGSSVTWKCSSNRASSNGHRYAWSPASGFSSSVSGSSTSTITWTTLRPGHRSIRCTVSGYYSRKNWSESGTRTLRVYHGPDAVSVTPNSPLTVDEGSVYGSSYPRCSPVSCDGCTGHWILNGQNAANDYILYSASVTVQRSHANVYTCEIWNRYSTTSKKSKNLEIIVHYGPDAVSTSPSGTVTVQEGYTYKNSMATCIASGCLPSCTTSWTIGSEVVSRNSYLFASSIQADRAHAGTYTCVGENVQTRTKHLALTVKYPPDVRTSWDDESRTLYCEVSGLPAIYNFGYWRHTVNGVSIRQLVGTKKSVSTLSFVFDRPSYEDTGDYICSVDNGLNSPDNGERIVKEGSQPVLIYAKPVVADFTESHYVSKGDRVDMPFEIYAATQGSVTLFRRYNNGTKQTIPASEYQYSNMWHTYPVSFYGVKAHTTVYRQTVTILTVTEGVFGNFTVRFENPQGMSEENITLIPKGPPDTPTNLDVTYVTHNSATLTFTTGFFNGASQSVSIEYKSTEANALWYLGVTIAAGIQSNVSFLATIEGLSPSTQYLFKAYAYNTFSVSQYTNHVTVTTLRDTSLPSAIVGAVVAGVTVVVIGPILVIIILICKRKGMDYGTCKESILLQICRRESRNNKTEKVYEDLRQSRISVENYEMSSVKESAPGEEDLEVYEDDVEPEAIPRQAKVTSDRNNGREAGKREAVGHTLSSPGEEELEVYEDDMEPAAIPKQAKVTSDCNNGRETGKREAVGHTLSSPGEEELEVYEDDMEPAAFPNQAKVTSDCNNGREACKREAVGHKESSPGEEELEVYEDDMEPAAILKQSKVTSDRNNGREAGKREAVGHKESFPGEEELEVYEDDVEPAAIPKQSKVTSDRNNGRKADNWKKGVPKLRPWRRFRELIQSKTRIEACEDHYEDLRISTRVEQTYEGMAFSSLRQRDDKACQDNPPDETFEAIDGVDRTPAIAKRVKFQMDVDNVTGTNSEATNKSVDPTYENFSF